MLTSSAVVAIVVGASYIFLIRGGEDDDENDNITRYVSKRSLAALKPGLSYIGDVITALNDQWTPEQKSIIAPPHGYNGYLLTAVSRFPM